MQHQISESRLEELWALVRNEQAPLESLSIEESAVLAAYGKLHKALSQSWSSAPPQLINAAKAIMPKTDRVFILAKILRPNFELGLARGAVSQIQFETDEVRIRAQVEALPRGWRIWGRTNVTGWTLWSGHSSKPCNDNGEFELLVESDSLQPLSLQNETTVILLPLSDNESDNGDE